MCKKDPTSEHAKTLPVCETGLNRPATLESSVALTLKYTLFCSLFGQFYDMYIKETYHKNDLP